MQSLSASRGSEQRHELGSWFSLLETILIKSRHSKCRWTRLAITNGREEYWSFVGLVAVVSDNIDGCLKDGEARWQWHVDHDNACVDWDQLLWLHFGWSLLSGRVNFVLHREWKLTLLTPIYRLFRYDHLARHHSRKDYSDHVLASNELVSVHFLCNFICDILLDFFW